jgi:hypothetical protein
MFTRILAGAEVEAALVWAAPAAADPDSMVAVAVNPQTGTEDTAYGSGKPIDYVIQDAIEACNLAGGPRCVYAGATTIGCAGIAFYRGNFEWSARPTTSRAEQAAKRKLIADGLNAGTNPALSAACSDGTMDRFSAVI